MSKKLNKIIKELEDARGISDYYLHRNYCNGEWELNIEFNNNVADDILEKNSIRECESCAYWE